MKHPSMPPNMANVFDPKMFSACLAPIPQCATLNDMGDTQFHYPKSSNRKSSAKTKERDGLRRMSGEVKKHVGAVSRRWESLMTKDDDSATLVTDVDLMRPNEGSSETESGSYSSQSFSSSSETGDLNTVAEDRFPSDAENGFGHDSDENNFAPDAENRFSLHQMQRKPPAMSQDMNNALGNNANQVHQKPPALSQDMHNALGNNSNVTNSNGPVVSPTSSIGAVYKTSVRSKFDYMRLQHQFSTTGQDPPCDQSMRTTRSVKAEDAMSLVHQWGRCQRRKNELAKQIMKRRQNVQKHASRTGSDP
jgi:hypothetical protein